jgi:hypothetical protein
MRSNDESLRWRVGGVAEDLQKPIEAPMAAKAVNGPPVRLRRGLINSNYDGATQ